MQANDVFRVNSPQVIYENIEGEVVLINLEKGLYYSTDQVGADVWDLMEAGCAVREMCAAIRTRYAGDDPQGRVGFEGRHLSSQFVLRPEVIRIEKREERALGELDAQVSRGRAPGVRLIAIPDRAVETLGHLTAAIR